MPFRFICSTVVLILIMPAFIHAQEKKQKQPRKTITPTESAEKSSEDRIHEILKQPASFDYQGSTLREIVEDIEQQHKLLMQIDTASLEANGIACDEADITMRITKVTLRSALRLLLRNLGLTIEIRDEALVITTLEGAADMPSTKVYDVASLVVITDEAGKPTDLDFDNLIDTIADAIAPETWVDMGGTYTISQFVGDGIAAIVVTQTLEGHEQVEKLLVDLKKLQSKGAMLPKRDKLQRWRGGEARDGGFGDGKRKGGFFRSTPPPLVPDSQRDTVVNANNDLAFALYTRLNSQQNDNICFSPYSISSALSMIYAGAKGETATELAQVLQYQDLLATDIHAGSRSLRDAIPLGKKEDRHQLVVANRLWGDDGYTFKTPFLDLLKRNHEADLVPVDFKKKEAACQQINAWVEDQTAGKIKDLLTLDFMESEDPLRFILTNAVYFKGNWDSPFKISKTKSAPFYMEDQAIQTKLMNQEDDFDYAEKDGVQVVQLPYFGDSLSMLVFLPERGTEKLKELEKSLDREKLDAWVESLKSSKVNIHFPKFEFEKRTPLKELLISMGMKHLFQTSADLSGISSEPELHIQSIAHKTYIKVNEKGTEAAAATGGFGGGGSFEKPKVYQFRADHPFVFLIRENRTGCILFLGRFSKPTANEPATAQ